MNEYYCKTMVDHEDRLSQLPDHLIHHIFAFLPVIFVVRTSLISKRWRWMWVSTSSLYFQGSRDDKYFLRFVENCLERRKLYTQISDTFMERFKFYLTYYDLSRCTSSKTVDDWLWFCTKNRVKELDLDVEHYCLPQIVLKPSTSLTQLKLKGLKLGVPVLSTNTFPALKVLSLEGVQSDSESLQNLIHGCPMMEDLHVDGRCVSFGEHFDVTFSGGTLRNLSLRSLTLSNQWLEGLVSEHRLLERLTLVHCNGCRNICIRSSSLKSVSVRESLTIQASFRTPNLVFLRLCCTNKSSISIEAPSSLEANLRLCGHKLNEASYHNYVRFLSNLNCLKKLVLCVRAEKVLAFPGNIRRAYPAPLPNLKHLKVVSTPLDSMRNDEKLWPCFEPAGYSELLDALRWCAPSAETLEMRREGSDNDKRMSY